MMKKIFTCFFAIIATTAVAGDNDWYVCGNIEIVNVNDKSKIPFRDCSDDNRMITLDNEHYVLKVENKSLEKDVPYYYTFKTGNGVDYCPAHDPNNYAKFTVNETATYDITYTFNINNRQEYGVELDKTGPADIVYSVAGDNVALFGGKGEWDYENEDTEMTTGDGYGFDTWNYTWTSGMTHFDEPTLINFRVYRNHDKEIFYGKTEYKSNRKWGDRGYDCICLVPAGDFVLTFIFNADKRTIQVNEGEPYYLRGDVNEWKIDDDYKFTRVSKDEYDRSIYILELDELSREFKFAVNGEWGNDQYGLNSTYNISSGYVFDLRHDQNAQNISLGEQTINDVIIMFSNNPPKARVSQVYALEHKGWGNNSNDWGWKELTKRSDDVWSVVAPYCRGVNVHYSNGTNDDDLGVYRKLKVVGDPQSLDGKECEFVFIPSTKEIIVGAKQSQEVKISIDGGDLQPMTSFGDGTYRLMDYYYLDNVKIRINGVDTDFTTKADAGLIPLEPCSYIFIPRNNGQNELYIQRGVITRIYDVEVSGYDSFEGSKAVKMIENGRVVIVKDGKKFNVMGQAIK